jgi:phosphomannomutase
VRNPQAVLDGVARREQARGAVVDRLDGVTVDHADWWYNLRSSNTEPLLRLNVEAADADACAQHVDEVLDLVSSLSTEVE